MMTREQFQESFQKVVAENNARLVAQLRPLIQDAVNEYCLDKPHIDYIELGADQYWIKGKNSDNLKHKDIPAVLEDMLFEVSVFMCGKKIYNTNG